MFRYLQRSTSPDLLGLLRWVSEDRALPALSSITDRQVKWIVEAGLGPLVWFASKKIQERKTRRYSSISRPLI